MARGNKVVATSRHAETTLAHLKDTDGAVLYIDITASQQDINAIAYEPFDQYGQIDVPVKQC